MIKEKIADKRERERERFLLRRGSTGEGERHGEKRRLIFRGRKYTHRKREERRERDRERRDEAETERGEKRERPREERRERERER